MHEASNPYDDELDHLLEERVEDWEDAERDSESGWSDDEEVSAEDAVTHQPWDD